MWTPSWPTLCPSGLLPQAAYLSEELTKSCWLMPRELGKEVMKLNRSLVRKVSGALSSLIPFISEQHQGGLCPSCLGALGGESWAACVHVPAGKVVVAANGQAKQRMGRGRPAGWGHHLPLLCSLTPLHSLRVHDPSDHHCQLHRAGP